MIVKTNDLLTSLLLKSKFLRLIYFVIAGFLFLGITRFINIYFGIKIFLVNYRLFNKLRIMGGLDSYIDRSITTVLMKLLQVSVEGLIDSKNLLYKSYLRTTKSKEYRYYFRKLPIQHRLRLRYPRQNDYEQRQGDLMILKRFQTDSFEKGVIFIKYTESIARLASVFDLERIAKHYRFVIEPSWWGYQNVNFLFLLGSKTDVVVEAPFHADFEFIKSLNRNLYAIKIGSGDWVNPNLFRDGREVQKVYDIVMVGHWGPIKRHKVFFKALIDISGYQRLKIALIGYPLQNRTKADIIKEAASYRG